MDTFPLEEEVPHGPNVRRNPDKQGRNAALPTPLLAENEQHARERGARLALELGGGLSIEMIYSEADGRRIEPGWEAAG